MIHSPPPGRPFVEPLYHVKLPVLPGATQYQIVFMKSQHDEALSMFTEYTLMQHALTQQVVSVKKAKRPSSLHLHNHVTSQLPSDLR